ncbi:HemK2/MTQ2 family protein methyltransferase [Methanolacinia paynteri]|uniref:HemK2/MTQ2 family protein methyltransferase n=1 Tax=Methanolacinia paynteri TaxID=230356 RepID=UPI00064F1204|nr:HemK2/MTQ2 family protein methyltransferase [Methanolacinia paynteri]
MTELFYHEQVYRPEEDTFLLSEAVMHEIKSQDRVIEIGTGSGFISSGIRDKAEYAIATDINPYACITAKKNGVEVVRTDLFSGICGTFDLVIFNPPYLPTKPEERIDDWLEYALDGGEDGRATIQKFAEQLGSALSKTGRCLLLISSLTGTDVVRKIFSELGFLSFIVAEKIVEDERLYVLRVIRDLCRL